MITSNQVLAHLIGDFFLQSDWMAVNKKDKVLPCFIHCLLYTVPFLFLTLSPLALFIIFFTHFIIDHWGPHRYFIYFKNFMAPKKCWRKWAECSITGHAPEKPLWLTLWLSIIVDNTIHLIINALSIRYL